MWLHTQNLNTELKALTDKLDMANVQLEQEIERGKRVEEITARIEQGEADRQKQLRRFERSLSELSEADNELRTVLRTVIPTSALRGLRSYKGRGDNTTVNGIPSP